jgi:polyisoprenoid-binding protein YceI
MNRFVLLLALAALAGCTQKDAPPQAQNEPAPAASAPAPATPAEPAEPAGEPSRTAALAADVPAGEYKMDHAHSTLIFRLSHMGFSHYTSRFRRFDAKLQFDPRNLTATQLTATIDPRSIETDYPDPKYNFNAELAGEQFLDAAKYPEIAFRTIRVEDLGNQAMRVHGELTMHGVTRPIVLDATYNGGYAGHPMDPQARIGFSAHGVLRRSEFGISGGIPQAGTNLGVGDQVAVVIESEFNGPPLAKAEQPTTGSKP